MRLDNKVVVITGAGNGIGKAGALRFAAEGARVVVGDIDAASAAATVGEIRAQGGLAVDVIADASTEEGNNALVDQALESFGGLDVVWANAGTPQPYCPIVEIPASEFDRVMAINAKGPWLLARAAVPALSERGGAVLVTASLSGLMARPGISAYSASKGAVVAMVRTLAVELAPLSIRVNSIAPVGTVTQMLDQVNVTVPDKAASLATVVDGIPLGRLGSVDDMANAALFLASDEASLITGVNLPVDGGALA